MSAIASEVRPEAQPGAPAPDAPAPEPARAAASAAATPERAIATAPRNGVDAAAVGYGIAAVAVIVGWITTRYFTLFDSQDGAGYWIGIVGASLMAVLLLYPVRKRVRWLRFLGATKYWFRIHMIFGVAGPILILYHCNFHFGSLNSTVALACTLLVAGSGLVGRYLHAKVFSDLDGHRRTLNDLIERARISAEQRRHITALVPDLIERMRDFDALVMVQPEGFWSSILLPPKLAFTTRIGQWRLSRHVRRELRKKAAQSPIIRERRKELGRALGRFVGQHLHRVRRVSELASWERLFSLWHVFHLPFFYMLILTALLHVLAVHMY